MVLPVKSIIILSLIRVSDVAEVCCFIILIFKLIISKILLCSRFSDCRCSETFYIKTHLYCNNSSELFFYTKSIYCTICNNPSVTIFQKNQSQKLFPESGDNFKKSTFGKNLN